MSNSDIIYKIAQGIAPMKPSKVKPDNKKQMLRLENLLDSSEYVAEEKIDGCHYMAIADHFFSTDKVEKTENFGHIQRFFQSLNMPNLILDGEMNYPGKTSQFATHVTGASAYAAEQFQREYGNIHYTIWDMLRTPKGTWLVNTPLEKRREMLEYFYNNYIKGTPHQEYIHLTKWVPSDKRRFRDTILATGGEGIVLKRKDSLYVMGKKPAWQWIKIKKNDTADLFISGYEPPKVEYTGNNFDGWPYWADVRGDGNSIPVTKYYYMNWIGAIELSAYVNGTAQVICTCSGISEDLREAISKSPDSYLNRVVKVEYMETTEAGFPRHPRFKEFHESKIATECEWTFEEEIDDQE